MQVGRSQRISLGEVKAAESLSNPSLSTFTLLKNTAQSLSRQGRNERWAPSLSAEPTGGFISGSLWIKRLWNLNRERAERAPVVTVLFDDRSPHAPRACEEVNDEVITCAALREERAEE